MNKPTAREQLEAFLEEIVENSSSNIQWQSAKYDIITICEAETAADFDKLTDQLIEMCIHSSNLQATEPTKHKNLPTIENVTQLIELIQAVEIEAKEDLAISISDLYDVWHQKTEQPIKLIDLNDIENENTGLIVRPQTHIANVYNHESEPVKVLEHKQDFLLEHSASAFSETDDQVARLFQKLQYTADKYFGGTPIQRAEAMQSISKLLQPQDMDSELAQEAITNILEANENNESWTQPITSLLKEHDNGFPYDSGLTKYEFVLAPYRGGRIDRAFTRHQMTADLIGDKEKESIEQAASQGYKPAEEANTVMKDFERRDELFKVDAKFQKKMTIYSDAIRNAATAFYNEDLAKNKIIGALLNVQDDVNTTVTSAQDNPEGNHTKLMQTSVLAFTKQAVESKDLAKIKEAKELIEKTKNQVLADLEEASSAINKINGTDVKAEIAQEASTETQDNEQTEANDADEVTNDVASSAERKEPTLNVARPMPMH